MTRCSLGEVSGPELLVPLEIYGTQLPTNSGSSEGADCEDEQIVFPGNDVVAGSNR